MFVFLKNGGKRKGEIFIKRPICVASCFYVIGILIGLYFEVSIAFLCCVLLLVSIFIIIWSGGRKWIMMLALLLIGTVYIHYSDNNYEQKYSRNIRTNNVKGSYNF